MVAVLFSGGILSVHVAEASLVDELREKIGERAGEINKLQAEIDQFEEEVSRVGKEAETLKGAIRILDTTDKKLGTDIRITEQKTFSTALQIEKLGIEITEREKQIGQNSKALGEAIRQINEAESRSLAEIILSNLSFSTFWKGLESLERFQVGVQEHVKELQSVKTDLVGKKNQSEKEKKNLLALTLRLADQKDIVEENKEIKNHLLKETKNRESSYKSLLEDRIIQKEALEKELQEYEERLRIEIDPTSLPETGTGVLRWPLDSVKITQYFGNTPFATVNPQIYNNKGHNGIDLRASVGTPIKSAARGVVSNVGNTDEACYGVSYGKWVLVQHGNGLSTLYAHLSLIRVSPGQELEMGDVLGYSGSTGYSTGPHLHFTVFATKAVIVSQNYKSKICGTFLTLPLSAPNGYLNPLSFLPPLR